MYELNVDEQYFIFLICEYRNKRNQLIHFSKTKYYKSIYGMIKTSCINFRSI